MARKFQLRFDPDALTEWSKLDGSIKQEFKPILERRLENPFIESARLKGELHDCFKIKSKHTGCRLIYTVQEKVLIVTIISVGKRENLLAFKNAAKRRQP